MVPILEIAELTAIGGLAAVAVAQRQRIQHYKIDPIYGCYTRIAVNAEPPKDGAIVFWDIDHMHDLNERWGYDGVDSRIREAMTHIRMTRGCRLVARWYSGDEFVYNCPAADAAGAGGRIKALFAEQDISVTLSHSIIQKDEPWHEAASRATRAVQAAKKNGQRGVVLGEA